ncbi:uncharacterized protein N7518_002891 [Penicillium psychrosexuale]|uniref:uncharacterized protein n=1 Tax=Penicillium psychrosexuale TaxID=1002107 RepID=UPI0025457F5D|nr:uncharacterized protein N7518_002891 [Penicillium psychrosexuale]KAJ5800823.1 hypothetical protein N7518_002891 [Penicillium psychrosexuale]
MALFTLPSELLAIITSLSDTETLKALRLTNHMLCASATKNLFSTVSLFTEDISCEAFESIITHPQLKEYVHKIRLNTVEFISDPDTDNDELEPPVKWKELLLMLPNIPNLKSVVLRFDKYAAMGGDSWFYPSQSLDYRETILEWLGTGLVSLKRPLEELGIQHQQKVTPLSEDLQQVLSTLSSLRLNVVHECDPACTEAELEKQEVREFYAHTLSSVWLKPTMGSLRKLSLYSDLYWGFYPKFSLEGVHFPNLQSLTLGNFSFFEDQQVDWILSHSSTLHELYLDDCTILFQVRLSNVEYYIDDCPVPISKMKWQTSKHRWGEAWHYHYPRRWNEYFASFETGLPYLRRFAIGHNEAWDSGYNELPFEKELDLRPALMCDRYMKFDSGTGPSHFLDPRGGGEDREDWPQCDDEDREGLKALYRKINQQVDCGDFDVGHYEVSDLVEIQY